MKVAVMQPYFFPYIGYWQLISAVDRFVIYDDVNFIKGGWVSRNKVLLNGEPKYLNLTLAKASPNKRINEIQVLNNKSKVESLLHAAYRKAPNYSKTMHLVSGIMSFEDKNLSSFLENSIRAITGYLGIKNEIIISSNISKDNSLKGNEKLLEICKKVGCSMYINPIGGLNLYSELDFFQNDISLKFLKTNEISYNQSSSNFISNLSIIDVLMFNDLDNVRRLLKCYGFIRNKV